MGKWRLAVAAIVWLLAAPLQAQQVERLELWDNYNGGLIYYYNDGPDYLYNGTWFWFYPSSDIKSDCFWFAGGAPIYFAGAPAVISDQPGRRWVVAKTTEGYLVDNVETDSTWRGWCPVPGSGRGGAFPHAWNADSSPALASWGPGRLELFINTTNQFNGNTELLHTWADNGNWSGSWEVLGTGIFIGSPAAVSWGPGRTDVFVGGPGRSLAHKWFANGQWSSGWDYLGGYMTSSPTVTSWGPNRLDVFVRGGDAQLWHLWYDNGWAPWESLGGSLQAGSSPAAASRGYLSVDAFIVGYANGIQHKLWNPQSGWSAFGNMGALNNAISAMAWQPFRPPPPPPPPRDPPPDPKCLRACP